MKFVRSVLSLVCSPRLQEKSDGVQMALIIVEAVLADIWGMLYADHACIVFRSPCYGCTFGQLLCIML